MKIFDFTDIRDYNGTATRQHYTRIVVTRHLLPVVLGAYNWIDNLSVTLPRQDAAYLKAGGPVHVVFHNNTWETQGPRLKQLWSVLSVMNLPIFWKPAGGGWSEVHQVQDDKFYLTTDENQV
jgi:hypothetical protein